MLLQFCAHHVLDPCVGLSLRINKQSPAQRELGDHAVLHRQVVFGQTGYLGTGKKNKTKILKPLRV